MLPHPRQPKKLNLKSDHTESEIRHIGISLKAFSPTMAMGNGGRILNIQANRQHKQRGLAITKNKKTKRSKQAHKQINAQATKEIQILISAICNVACFFLVRCSGCSHCVGPSVACFSRIVGLSCKKKLQLINRNRPCTTNSEASPGLRKWLLGLADLSEGCVHLI